jgi:hypothetical protein
MNSFVSYRFNFFFILYFKIENQILFFYLEIPEKRQERLFDTC